MGEVEEGGEGGVEEGGEGEVSQGIALGGGGRGDLVRAGSQEED